MSDQPRILQLESSDGYILDADIVALKMSKKLKTTIKELGYDTNEAIETRPIPVKDVCGSTLQLVLEWCEKRKHDGPSGPFIVKMIGKYQKDLIMPKWDQKFFRKIHNRQLFDLVCAAHSLGIGPLMEIGCKAISNLAKGKTAEEIRVIYGIKPDWEEPSTSTATWD